MVTAEEEVAAEERASYANIAGFLRQMFAAFFARVPLPGEDEKLFWEGARVDPTT